jgi:cytosine/adenosine deaminase-related metal-dependent hydrolase
MTHDLIIRNGYVWERKNVVDVAIDDDTIVNVSPETDATGDVEIDAEGNVVSSGLVDSHVHLDKALAADGERFPRGSDESYSVESMIEHENRHYEESSFDDLVRNAVKDVRMAVAAGSTYLRSHVAVDPDLRSDNVRATLEAKEKVNDIADVQLCIYGEGEDLLRESIETSLERAPREDVLLGGIDPASRHNDVERTLERWFEIATDYDIGIDLHIQDGGTLGIYTLERLIEYIEEYDYQGRVTASHCFCLAHAPEPWWDQIVEKITSVDLKVVTCYNSTRADMPIKELTQSEVTVGHGTDNHRDFVSTHGNADSVEAALIEANKLHGDSPFEDDYRWFGTNAGLAVLWDMMTTAGAKVLDVDDYGVKEGTSADLVVWDAQSPQWVINKQATRRYVLKDGTVVAEDGELRPRHTDA